MAASTPESTPESAPEHDLRAHAPAQASRTLTRQNVFIALFIGVQIGMPLSYYLGERGYDERFSWRMFSTLRLQQCSFQVEERHSADAPHQRVALARDVQVAWVNLLERNRSPVVEAYLTRRCEGGAHDVRYVRKCVDTDGSQLPEQRIERPCGPEASEGAP